MHPTLFLVWWTLLGLVVGSFLNVAIHRLPLDGESVSKPRRSRCPSCRHELTWKENLPLVSWLVQLGKCRSCGWSIPWRYPLVEVLTGGLWFAAAWSMRSEWMAGPGEMLGLGGSGAAGVAIPWNVYVLLLVRVVILSGLIVATFVDFDYFEIPDQVSIGGIVLAPLVSLILPSIHADTWVARYFSEGLGVDRAGALVGCLAGMFVGGGILLAIGWVGKRVYGTDAMGFGDVKLLAGAGGFLGPGGVLVALMLAAVVASVAGVGNVLRFTCLSQTRAKARGVVKSLGRSFQIGRIAGRYLPFGPYLGIGIGIVLLAWKDVVGLWG